VQLYPYALTGHAGIYSAATHTDVNGAFYLDGSALLLVGSVTFDHVTLSLTSVTAAQLHGIYLGASFGAGANLVSTAVQLQFAPHTVRLGGTGLVADLPGRAFWALGVTVGLTADRSFTDAGPYRGLDLEKLADVRGVDLQTMALRRLELRQLRGASLGVRAGGGTFTAAGVARLDFAGSQQRTLRMVRSDAEARALLYASAGRHPWLTHKLQALRLRRDVVAWPDVHAPDTLAIGEEINHMRALSCTPSAIGGSLAAFAGLQLVARRDFELSVHRLDARRVEVTVAPSRIRALGLFACSPFGPQLHLGANHASTVRHSYIFTDLHVPATRAAFERVLAHGAPGIWQPPPLRQAHKQAPHDLARAVRDDTEHLPQGVTRSWVHRIRSDESRLGGGIDVRVIPQRLTPQGWVMALGQHRSRIRETQVVTDGSYTSVAQLYTHRVTHERFFAGCHIHEASGQIRWHRTDAGAMLFDGWSWRVHITLAGKRGPAVARHAVKPLQERLGLQLRPVRLPKNRQTRNVTVTQTLSERVLGLPDDHPSCDAQWLCAARDAGVAPRHVTALRQRLAAARAGPSQAHQASPSGSQAGPAERQAYVLQKFIGHHGLAACAMLLRLTRAQQRAHVHADNPCGEAALAAVRACRLRYGSAPWHDTCPKAVWSRLVQVIAAQQQLTAANRLAEADPFGPTQGPSPMQEALQLAEAELAELLVRNVADRQALRSPLRAQGRTRWPMPFRRSTRRIRQAVDGWLEPADTAALAARAVLQTYQGVALPWDLPHLTERWSAVTAAAKQLQVRLRWLDAADIPLPAGERTEQRRHLQHLLDALEGVAGSGGLVALQTLPPHVRQTLGRKARRSPVAIALHTIPRPLLAALEAAQNASAPQLAHADALA
jgi:hypothetical protein